MENKKVLITLLKVKEYEELKKILDEWKESFSELVDDWVTLTLNSIREDKPINVEIKKPSGPIKKINQEVEKKQIK